MKGSRTVTDKFSLRTLVRKHTPQNGRKYLFEAVSRAINSPTAKERMSLGEMFGYYGHGRREQHYNKTGSLRLPEFTVLMVEGVPVPVNNVPSNRTLDIKLDGDIVTHTQEILDTDTGRIVDGMERGAVGGWSWATGGTENAQGAHVRVFEGFDYVTTPNFISLNRKTAMLESATDREAEIVKQMIERGYSEAAAVDIAQHFENMRLEQAMLESAVVPALETDLFVMEGHLIESLEKLDASKALLESVQKSEAARKAALSNFIDKLPVFVTTEQREALGRMNTPEDMAIVTALFESVMSQHLPTNKRDYSAAPATGHRPNMATKTGFVQPIKVPRFE
ncbi:head processing protein [Enterobacter hormaechei]